MAAANLLHGTVSVSTTATQIRPSTSTRQSLTVQNLGTVDVYIGGSSVTASNGVRIAPQKAISNIIFTGAVYGIAATAGQDVRYFEEYN